MPKHHDDFEKIYEDCIKEVYYYCLSLTKDIHNAEELTQETFFKALKSFHQFRGDCKPGVWLCQIAKNTYCTQAKWQKRFVPADSFSESEIRTTDTKNVSPEKEVLEQENIYLIHQILHRLPEPYKEVFHLRTFSELSFSQIGNLFGKTENWARVTYYRARQQIQKKWKEDCNGNESM